MGKITKKSNIASYSKPKIIAEISGNHAGRKLRFLKLIKEAFKNGADLVKIQTYEPKDITLKKKTKNFIISSGLWKNKSLWDLYRKACTPFDWHKDAFKIARKLEKNIFSSPFSLRSVDILEKYKCPIYKIASFEITDFKLINYIASKKKPIIISTGMAQIKEIKNAIKLINKYHNKITILHCVSNYPTEIRDSNLKKIDTLKKQFPKNKIGLSDHTKGIATSVLAAQMGVEYIEKHFNLDSKRTADSAFSIDSTQLKELKNVINYMFLGFRKEQKVQKKNLFLRRSIFSKRKIKKNEKITIDNIETYRPKIGICASKYFKILGKRSKKNIKANEPIFQDQLL